MDKQRTIKRVIQVKGNGLHTGKDVTITFRPAPVGHGICFIRTDLEGKPQLKADCDLVIDTSRGTTIGSNGVVVNTTEHVLAAFTGLGIDNAIIEIDNVETPILDGSSRFFAEALAEAGIEEQEKEREYLVLDQILNYTNPQTKTEIIAIPSDTFKLTVMIDFETEVLNSQNAVLNDIRQFKTEIANCRTFVFLHELEYLLNNNLIRGGDLANAIVFTNEAVPQDELNRLAKLFNKPSVQVLNKGILNNVDLLFENEPARHKLLDVVGDLTLVGKPIKAHIIATRPGHKSNVEFAKIIKRYMEKKEQDRFKPPFDLYKTPLIDINAIKKILPHRPPFLLIDKIMDMTDKNVVGVKNVTMNEGFFVGHFPDEPVMPGVLQIEAMAQTGGIFALSSVPDPENYLTYFLKIDNVKFRSKVVPGDTLVFSLELVSPIRRGLVNMSGVAYVGDKIVMQGDMLAQIARKNDKQ